MDLIEENQSEVLVIKESLKISLGLEEISGEVLAGYISFSEIGKLLGSGKENYKPITANIYSR